MFFGAGQEQEVAEWRRVVKEELATPTPTPHPPPPFDEGGIENRGIGGNGEGGVGVGGREGGGGGGGWRTWGKGKREGGGGREGKGSGEGGRNVATHRWVKEIGGFLSLPEVEVSDGKEFMEAFVNRSRPAVIKVWW